jgi:diguanylate cyclase (GGDEF)-like protein
MRAGRGRLTALDDPERLAELERLRILDTPREANFDTIATLGAAVMRSPVAAVNFVDGERHYTKSIAGIPRGAGGSVPNGLSFCAATVTTPDGVLVVEDTRTDPRWRAHDLVVGEPGVGFYAGVAIVSRGERVGVVCAFGDEPRPVSGPERSALVALATQAGAQLELRTHAAELHAMAVTDPLTRLPNRALLMDRLDVALAARADTRSQVGVLFCDVDGFKAINDALGHEAGDRVLRHVAERLGSAMRAGDTVARIGGDEFVAVCPRLPARGDLDALVARVAAALAEPSPVAPVGVSIGAILARPGEGAAGVLRRADAAMYAEKARR